MPTEIERLVVSFEANLKQYEREMAKMSALTVKEFRKINGAVAKSSKANEQQFAQMGARMKSAFTNSLKGFGAGIAATIIGSFGFDAIRDLFQKIGDIGDAAKGIGVTSDYLQIMQKSMVLAGGQTDDMTKALTNMSLQLEDTDSEMVKFLQDNNIDVAKFSTEELIKKFVELAGRITDSGQKLRLLKEVTQLRGTKVLDFLDAATNLDEAARSARYTAEEIKQADDMAKALTNGIEDAKMMFGKFLMEVTDTDDAEAAIQKLVAGFGGLLTLMGSAVQYVKDLDEALRKSSLGDTIDKMGKFAPLGLGPMGGAETPILSLKPGSVADLLSRGEISEAIAEDFRTLKELLQGGSVSDALKNDAAGIGEKLADGFDAREIGTILRDFIIQGLNALDPAGAFADSAEAAAGDMSKLSSKGAARASTLERFLQGRFGFTEAVTKGIIAGLRGESGVNLTPTSKGDYDKAGRPTAFGVAQWREERFAGLKQMAGARGKTWEDPTSQFLFMAKELEGKFAHVAAMLKRATSPEEALRIWVKYFEIPADIPGAIATRKGFIDRNRSRSPRPLPAELQTTPATTGKPATYVSPEARASREKAEKEAAEFAKFLSNKEMENKIKQAEIAGNKELQVVLESLQEAKSKGFEQGSKEYEQILAINRAKAGLVEKQEQSKFATEMEIEALERLKKAAEDRGDLEDAHRLEAKIDILRRGVGVTDEQSAALYRNAAAWAASERAAEQYKLAQEQIEQIGGMVSGAFKGFVHDLIEGKSATEALSNALLDLGQQLMDMAIDLAFKQLFSSLGGGGAGALAPILGAAEGGSFRVKGKPGRDNNVVPLRLSRGEIVDVTPANEARLSMPAAQSLRPWTTAASPSLTLGGSTINIDGSADERTIRMIDERLRANNSRQLNEIYRNLGPMNKRYSQLRAP